MRTTVMVAWFAAALVLVGALQPVAFAQQQEQSDLFKAVSASSPPKQGIDLYDVGAGVVTVAKAPFNAVLCLVGGVAAGGLFVLTLGTGYKASTRVIEEGCSGPWVVSGDDLRPDSSERSLYER